MRKICVITLAVFFFAGCGGPEQKKDKELTKFQAWPANIEVRTCPGSFSREPGARKMRLEGLSGEILSAQVVVNCSSELEGLSGEISDLSGERGNVIPAESARVRYGAYLPVDETMTLTADPLLEKETVDVPANQAQSVWLTLKIPAETAPGNYSGRFAISESGGQAEVFDLAVEVLPAALPDPRQWSFYLNIWQDPSGVARAHKVKPWSEEHWALLKLYASNYAEHGMDVITAGIVYDPWESQSGYPYETTVEWKYPGEFTRGTADKFTWDFTVFDRYIQLMTEAGVDRKIDCFSMVKGPGSNKHADIRYLDTRSGRYRDIKITLGDPAWKEIWTVFLPRLREHLKGKGWYGKAFLAFDEKPRDDMRSIYDFLLSVAPDFKVSIAGGYPGDERKWSDEVILHVNELLDERNLAAIAPLIRKMRSEGRYISFYTACEPYYPNVFLFSRLREARLLPWLAWKYGLSGYLRWAVDAFPEDIWNQPNYKWHSGDMYFVYPGENGPVDGMRWELFRQGLEDYEALRIAWDMAQKAGREDLLDKLKAAVEEGTIIDSCSWIPFVGEARAKVNEVIRELGKKV